MRATEQKYKQVAFAVLLSLKKEYSYCETLDDVIAELETELNE